MSEEQTQVNTWLTNEIDNQLRRIAAEQRVSRSEIVRIAIEKYLAEYRIISIEDLPGPDGAEKPPVVTIAPRE